MAYVIAEPCIGTKDTACVGQLHAGQLRLVRQEGKVADFLRLFCELLGRHFCAAFFLPFKTGLRRGAAMPARGKQAAEVLLNRSCPRQLFYS